MQATPKDPTQRYREEVISVDIEASGPIPGEYSMVSLGACWLSEVSKTFYVELQPLPGSKADPDAMRVNGLDLSKLEAEGVEPAEAMRRFGRWVREVLPARPVFASFGTFDWMFVRWYMVKFLTEEEGANLFGPNSLDMKSFWMGAGGTDWRGTRKGNLPSHLRSGRKHTHNALDDAIEQAELFRRMLAKRDGV
ncbi:MAG: 3'-5' exonuclease [Euryarchaeota archaeon]|nr:3'-5' exonuclease [Euryarchaeota archaeon]MDE1835918.1 3'-5' exonuclease [Euryarchaeota archaeon]MDE1880207.1 3'-5' exonuclease [Euryarchaeota archaeon]MDE2044404.1 3'-5' exonuclease [Thermoplasmata archaeon]